MSDMTNSSYVLSGLSGDNLRVKRTDLVNLKIGKGLLSEMVLLGKGLSLNLNDPLLFFQEFGFHL
jgi:hypothetical protein